MQPTCIHSRAYVTKLTAYMPARHRKSHRMMVGLLIFLSVHSTKRQVACVCTFIPRHVHHNVTTPQLTTCNALRSVRHRSPKHRPPTTDHRPPTTDHRPPTSSSKKGCVQLWIVDTLHFTSSIKSSINQASITVSRQSAFDLFASWMLGR